MSPFNTWLGLLLHELLYQCSIAWKQSAQVALIVAFCSSVFLDMVSLIFQLIVPYRFSVGFRFSIGVRQVGWPIKYSNTMVGKLVTRSFGTVGRSKVLLEK